MADGGCAHIRQHLTVDEAERIRHFAISLNAGADQTSIVLTVEVIVAFVAG